MYILLGGHYILWQDLQKLTIRCELWYGHVYPIWRSAALETARKNATIRKDSKFVLDFASRNIKIDAVVTELAQLLWSSQVGPPRFGSYPKEDFMPWWPNLICLATHPRWARMHQSWTNSVTTVSILMFRDAKSSTYLLSFRMVAFLRAVSHAALRQVG